MNEKCVVCKRPLWMELRYRTKYGACCEDCFEYRKGGKSEFTKWLESQKKSTGE